MNKEYKYDVAFSFLQKDEQLAVEIASLVRDRVTVNDFVYSQRQNELVGTDGIDELSKVFGEDSRIVVILYRENWGQTPWTRVEETAIKNRSLEDGHGFIIFVPMETPLKAPKWIPKARIYYGLDKYGIDGLGGVIENRVQAEGGTVKNVTAVDKATKLATELEFRQRRRDWRASEQGGCRR